MSDIGLAIRPRRPTMKSKTVCWEPIVEKPDQKSLDASHARRRSISNSLNSTGPRRSSILAQPQLPQVEATQIEVNKTISRPARRRQSSVFTPQDDTTAYLAHIDQRLEPTCRMKPRRESRRQTLWIAEDDTTTCNVTMNPIVPQAIEPPANRRLSRLNQRISAQFDPWLEESTMTAQETRTTAPIAQRRQSLAVRPKRVPLQQSLKPLQESVIHEDVMGQNTGKENVPPGAHLDILGKVKPSLHPQRQPPVSTQQPDGLYKRRRPLPPGGNQISASLQLRRESLAMKLQSSTVPSVTSRPCPSQASNRAPQLPIPDILQPSHSFHQTSKPVNIVTKYPVLSEDVHNPELYEDCWLNHQETALSQLINSVFETFDTEKHDSKLEYYDLRRRIVSNYHDPSISILHRRLQASVLYGALALPKTQAQQASSLKTDIGRRQAFIDLWVDTYHLDVLQAAAEAVAGREIPAQFRKSSLSDDVAEAAKRELRRAKKAISKFLEAFFINHDDATNIGASFGSIKTIAQTAGQSDPDYGSDGWSWRRSVMRSLMLVFLLDRAKTSGIFSGCLFQKTSAHKSSLSVLRSLGKLILSYHGDISRPLANVDYALSSVQHPHQEYLYRIENMATDLRDGILIARLVESLSGGQRQSNRNTIDFDLSSPQYEGHLSHKENRLTRQLKFDCQSRVEKLHNVQLILDALANQSLVMTSIKASEIVDGHREKTLSFIWQLVSTCGVNELVDWAKIKQERLRLQQRLDQGYTCSFSLGTAFDNLVQRESKMPRDLLLELLHWAHAVAALHGLQMANLTTSFADGNIIAAIVDEYAAHVIIPQSNSNTPTKGPSSSSSSSSSTRERLKSLGCSTAFIEQILPQLSQRRRQTTTAAASPAFTIPSSTQTTTTLLFLASRLVPLASRHHAALTIQRAFRTRRQRTQAYQRTVLAQLASHCAIVVQARNRIVDAAVRIQRTWRASERVRFGRHAEGVVSLQAFGRGFQVRRGVMERMVSVERPLGRVGW